MKTSLLRRILPFAGLFAATLTPALHAVDRTWSGASGVNSNFTNTGNWQLGVVPVSSLTDDRAIFDITPGGSVRQPFLSGNRSINGLQFDTSGWNFTGGDFTLNIGDSGIISTVSSGTNIITARLGVSSTQTWKVATGGRLEVGETTGAGTLNLGASDASGAGTVALTTASSRTGATNIQGGIVEVGNNTAFGSGLLRFAGASTLNNSSAISIGNAVEFRSDLTVGGSGNLTFTGTVELGTNSSRTLTVNNSTTTFSAITQDVGGARNLVIQGTGAAVFAGASSYNGTTTVLGTLLVNGSLTNSAVTVQSSGVLGGSGQILQAVDVAGMLAPGNSIGTLQTGALSIGSTGTLTIELGRDGVTPVSDRVDATGSISLTSGANLELTLGSGLNPSAVGDTFWLVSNDGTDAVTGVFTQLNGAFTNLNEGSTFLWNSQEWQITYQADFLSSSFFGGNDIAIQVIPEPASGILFGLGAIAILLVRKSRRQASAA